MSGSAPGAQHDVGFFRPRRLAHANIFVGNYESAFDFYHRVVGFEEVYRQPDNRASFISNGNTYHDLALTDVRSPYAAPGQEPGLNHLAFEVECERDLVAGYRRAVQNRVRFESTKDHDVARSLYARDPDGNVMELYADVVPDWRSARRGIITGKKPLYVPGETSEPVAERYYPRDPEIRVVESSLFRARRVTHAGLVARDFEAMFDYYTDIVGLEPRIGERDGPFAVLGGSVGSHALTLYRSDASLPPGLHHVGIEMHSEADIDRALLLLDRRQVAFVAHVEHAARRVVMIRDPDGLLLQFYVNRESADGSMAGLTKVLALQLL